MLGWLRKKSRSYGERYLHESDRTDWDRVNAELYTQVIQDWANGVALISNTYDGRNDLVGPYVRLAPVIDPAIREELRGFTNAQFDRIFQLVERRKPAVADCFRVKKLGLPNKSLVYAVQHSQGPQRTLLVLGGERLKGRLEERLVRVNEILGRESEPGPAAAPMADGDAGEPAAAPSGASPGGEPPPLGSPRAVAKAASEQLSRREEYLDARRETLAYNQRIELERIQDELKRRSLGNR